MIKVITFFQGVVDECELFTNEMDVKEYVGKVKDDGYEEVSDQMRDKEYQIVY